MELIKAINREHFEEKVREYLILKGINRHITKKEIDKILDTYVFFLEIALENIKLDAFIEAIIENIHPMEYNFLDDPIVDLEEI